MTRRRSALVIAGILSVAVAGWLGLRVAGPAWTRLQHPTPKHTRTAAAEPGHPRIAQAREADGHEAVRADNPGEAMAFYLSKRVDSTGHMRPQNYLAARSRFEARPTLTNVVPAAMPAAGGATIQSLKPTTTAQSFAWQNIGPGNVGGRTRALIVDSTSSSTLWAGGVDGGIWKGTYSGSQWSWSIVSDVLPNIAITTLAQDPQNAKTFYAGTGEGFNNSDAERGDGIFVSTDSGATWSSLSSTANNSDFYYVNRIVVSPNSSSTLYAATNTGLWKGTNSGSTWTWSNMLPSNTVTNTVFDLFVQNVGGADYVYAYVEDDGVYVSYDGLATIYPAVGVTAGTVSSTAADTFYRGSIAMSAANPGVGYVVIADSPYDSDTTKAGGITGVWRTTDYFTTATQVLNLNTTSSNTTTAAQARLNATMFGYPVDFYSPNGDGKTCAGAAVTTTGQQGWYDQAIAVDPTDTTGNTLWIGGTDLWRSTDGGVTFELASDEEQTTPSNTTATAGAIHSDQHVIVYSPNYSTDSTIYFGNDGGIFNTTNASAGVLDTTTVCGVLTGSTSPSNPVKFLSLNNGYGVTQFYNGSVPVSGTGYFGGAQDNGTQLYQGGVNTWKSLFGGDGGDTAISPTLNSAKHYPMYYSYINISVVRSDDGGATNTATSSSYNYTYVTDGITSGGSGLFINPYVLDTNTGHTTRMFVTNHDLWMTDDATVSTGKGPAWTDLGTLDSSNNGSALAVAPSNSNVVYVGLENGTFYKLLNPP